MRKVRFLWARLGTAILATSLAVAGGSGISGASGVPGALGASGASDAVFAAVDHTPADFPVTPFEVVAHFDPPEAKWLTGHRGIDLAAHVDQTVRSPAAGVIHFAGMVAGRPVLTVQLPHGDLLSFGPLASDRRRGEQVAAGEKLRVLTADPGHCAPQACLHVGLRRAGNYLNPLILWPQYRQPIVLLPPLER